MPQPLLRDSKTMYFESIWRVHSLFGLHWHSLQWGSVPACFIASCQIGLLIEDDEALAVVLSGGSYIYIANTRTLLW